MPSTLASAGDIRQHPESEDGVAGERHVGRVQGPCRPAAADRPGHAPGPQRLPGPQGAPLVSAAWTGTIWPGLRPPLCLSSTARVTPATSMQKRCEDAHYWLRGLLPSSCSPADAWSLLSVFKLASSPTSTSLNPWKPSVVPSLTIVFTGHQQASCMHAGVTAEHDHGHWAVRARLTGIHVC